MSGMRTCGRLTPPSWLDSRRRIANRSAGSLSRTLFLGVLFHMYGFVDPLCDRLASLLWRAEAGWRTQTSRAYPFAVHGNQRRPFTVASKRGGGVRGTKARLFHREEARSFFHGLDGNGAASVFNPGSVA